MHPTLIAEYLCNRQPLPVRARLIEDEGFGARFHLKSRSVITVGDILTVDQHDLIVAARRALSRQEEQRLVDLNDTEIVVAADQGAVVLRRAEEGEKGREVRFPELAILSSRPDDRTEALNRLLDRIGPAAPDFSRQRQAVEERELSDDEIDELLEERYNGVAALQARAAAAFEGQTPGLAELIPDALNYYERFCGPNPGVTGPEEYVGVALPTYRKELLRRDLARGLDICLLGALRDDLMPGSWTGHLSDDELWDALSVCDPDCNPVSLLGALDIALHRQHDGRYQDFAEDAVKKLVQEEYPRPDGADTYELLPLFAELVLDRINGLDGGASRAPYWKRMCAWMQAGLLARTSLHLKIDVDRLRRWARSQRSPAMTYAAILDLRQEPMFRASDMSCDSFRAETIGVLAELRSRHETAGRATPQSRDIDNAMSAIADRGSPLRWAQPGPLEGHRRPAETKNRNLPPEVAEKLTQELAGDSGGLAFSKLAYFSQCFDLGQELLRHARTAIAQVNLDCGNPERQERLTRLGEACMIAAAQRDVELARAIGARVVSTAPGADSGDGAIAILRVLLLAGAAFENQEEWAEWLEQRLFELAARLPTGEPSQLFLSHMGELKKVLDLTLAIHTRAEAMASAAN